MNHRLNLRLKTLLIACAILSIYSTTILAQCTTCTSLNKNTTSIGVGDTYCYTINNSPAFNSTLNIDGRMNVCGGSTFDYFGSIAIYSGSVYLYDCSKMNITGTISDFGVTKITSYCSECDKGSFEPVSVGGTAWLTVDCLTALPVEFIDFNVKLNEKDVHINWVTGSEINNKEFTIQKSFTGELWQDIEIVEGAGNSVDIIEYESIDVNAGNGTIYYRIRQEDFDGNFSYSVIAVVQATEEVSFEVYPNPTQDNFTIEVKYWEYATLKITDVFGRSVYQQELPKKSDPLTPLTLSFDGFLSQGVYFVVIESPSNILSKKLVVK